MKTTHRRVLPLSAILLTLAASGLLWAAQAPLSLEMLCGKAERIVVGEVVASVATNDEWPGIGTIPVATS